MLDPDELNIVGDDVAAVYQEIEAEMIAELARSLAANGFTQDNTAKLRKIARDHQDEVDGQIRQTAQQYLALSDVADIAIIAGAVKYPQKVEAVARGLENWARRLELEMPEAAQRLYRKAVTQAAVQVSSGRFSVDGAVRDAVRMMADQGIDIVQYSTDGKRAYGMSVEAAVRGQVRVQLSRASQEMTMERMREAGCTLVEVSSHVGARPSHAEWHGRCYSLTGEQVIDGVHYPDYYQACKVGDLVEGIFGYNCRHSVMPYVHGTPHAFSPHPEHSCGMSNDEYYKLTQQQRFRERGIRQAKRRVKAAQAVYDENPTPENQIELQKQKELLRNRQASMREFVKQTNANAKPGTQVITREYQREWVPVKPSAESAYAASSIRTRSGFAKCNWKFEREYGAVYDSHGRLIPGTITEGYPGHVHFKRPPGGWKDTRVVHTHDGEFGGCFSVGTKESGDLYHLLDADLIGYDAVCREGVYKITRKRQAPEDERKRFWRDARKVERDAENEASDKLTAEWMAAGKLLTTSELEDEFNAQLRRMQSDIMHAWLSEHAGEYGYRYTFTPRNEVK